MSDADDIELSDVIRLAMEARLATAHVSMPARVLSFSAERNTVDVQPEMDRAIKTADGSLLEEPLPAIASVPVLWPRSRNWAVTFGLAADDRVLIVCTDRNLGEWRRNASADPKHVGTHRLDGAVAIPGLFPLSGAVASERAPSDGLRVGWVGSGDGPEIVMGGDGMVLRSRTSGGVELAISQGFSRVQVQGGGALDGVAQSSKTEAEFLAINATLASLAGATFGTPYVPGFVTLAASKFRTE